MAWSSRSAATTRSAFDCSTLFLKQVISGRQHAVFHHAIYQNNRGAVDQLGIFRQITHLHAHRTQKTCATGRANTRGGRVYKLSFEKYPPTSTVRIDTHTAALKQRQPQFGGQRHKHYIHVDFRAASRRPHSTVDSATTNLLCKSYKRVLNVYRELARRSAQHVSVLVGSCDGPVTVVGISGSVICSRCACAPPFATPRPPRWRVRARH